VETLRRVPLHPFLVLRFNGATPFQAWKPCRLTLVAHRSNRFNGATPFQAWKRKDISHSMVAPTPLQWGHAFSGVETKFLAGSFNPSVVRFNGATPFQAWKPYFMRGCLGRNQRASMGPRLFRRGNFTIRVTRAICQARLQWGHAFSGVETDDADLVPARDRGASMGPRLFRRGNMKPRWMRMAARSISFNGATPFQAWKPAARSRGGCNAAQLQWGHAFSGVETRRAINHLPTMTVLQWGHAFSGVETIAAIIKF